jgi:hypothetical protein
LKVAPAWALAFARYALSDQNAPIVTATAQTLRDVLGYLDGKSIATWVFGGWGEELRSLAAARPHGDIDLLYPSDSFAAIDSLIRQEKLQEIVLKRSEHKRAIVISSVMTEIFLLRRDGRGPHTLFWGQLRHDWPADVLGRATGLRVASAAALASYRSVHHQVLRARRLGGDETSGA